MILTDEDIFNIDASVDTGFFGQQNCVDYARAIEAEIMERFEVAGYFAAEYMGGPVIHYQVNLSSKDEPGVFPLYALKEKK